MIREIEQREFLYLNLTKDWYDLIESGFKKEEYRDISPYYNSRFRGKNYKKVVFINGYHKDARRMCFEVLEIKIAAGNPKWGGSKTEKSWVIRLGRRCELPK